LLLLPIFPDAEPVGGGAFVTVSAIVGAIVTGGARVKTGVGVVVGVGVVADVGIGGVGATGVGTVGVGVVGVGAVGVGAVGVTVASGKLAVRISVPEKLPTVSMKPAPSTVADAPKKSEITTSSVALTIPSLLMSITKLVPCRAKPIVPDDSHSDREGLVMILLPKSTKSKRSMPPLS
jgi:hypothetical protein